MIRNCNRGSHEAKLERKEHDKDNKVIVYYYKCPVCGYESKIVRPMQPDEC